MAATDSDSTTVPALDADLTGYVVRVRKATYSGLLEVDYCDDLIVSGRIPYASTYEPGGKYFGSYRGRQSVWRGQVEAVVRSTQGLI